MSFYLQKKDMSYSVTLKTFRGYIKKNFTIILLNLIDNQFFITKLLFWLKKARNGVKLSKGKFIK